MEMVHYVILLLSLPMTATAITVTAECVSQNAIKFEVQRAATGESYVQAAIYDSINTTTAAAQTACYVDISDGTKKSLSAAFGTCETPAAEANKDMVMKLIVSENAAYTANSGYKVYSATCKYDANGNPVMTAAVSLTSNSVGGTPTDVPASLTITTTAVDAAGVAVSACTVGGTPSNFYLLSSATKAGSVEGIYMVSMSYMNFAQAEQTFMTGGCTTAGHVFIGENVGSKPFVDAPPDPTKVKARISQPIQCFRPHNVGTLTFKLQVGVCTVTTDARCATKGCPNDARKKRDVTHGTIKLFNSTVVITPIRPEQDLNSDKLCSGYISSTVFYAVVIVLAVLLVVTIGVAAFFGARARLVVVREGKDNQSYS